MTINSALKSKLKPIMATVALSVVVLSFQNFTKLNTETHPELGGNPEKDNRMSVVFNKKNLKSDSNIDLIFFIDNSNIKKNRKENIQKSVDDFIRNLDQRTDLNLAIFSNHESSNKIELKKEFLRKGYLQIHHKRGMANFLDDSISVMPNLIKKDFLRERSHIIIVLIGNEDFQGGKGTTTNEEFIEKMSTYANVEQMKLYSIVGLNSEESPCAPISGLRAIDLAQSFGGQSFNVCEKDWSKHFNMISQNISRLTNTRFLLPTPPHDKMAVRVDGVITDNYTLDGQSIVLNTSHFSEEKEYVINVDYLSR